MTAPLPSEPVIASAPRPTIVLAGAAGALGSVRETLRTAAHGPFYAVDLDVRQSWWQPSWRSVSAIASRETVRVRSIWLPEHISGIAFEGRSRRLDDFLRHGRDEFGLRELIVPRLTSETQGFNVSRLARDLSKRTNGAVRLAIGIRAETLIREPDHLDRISAIRRAVEEWDLDIALDLTGDVSSRWEAEAVVARILPRLALVRLNPWLRMDGVPDSGIAGHLAGRTIAMLMDQGYSGIISLHPFTAAWPNRVSTPAALAIAELLQEDVLSRHARMSAALRISTEAPFPHPSPDRPTRDL